MDTQQTFVFGLYMVVSLVMSKILASPLSQPTIDNPCMLDPSAPIELQPIVVQIRAAITETNAAARKCQAYTRKIRSDRLLTDQDFRRYSNESLQLPGLPIRRPEVNISTTNMTDLIKQHYNDTSLLIFYLNVAISQQIDYAYSRYVPELRNIRNSFYRSLCKIFYITKSINTTITQFLDSSAVPCVMINLSGSKQRYYRNLLVATQGRLVAQTESMNYAELLRNEQSPEEIDNAFSNDGTFTYESADGATVAAGMAVKARLDMKWKSETIDFPDEYTMYKTQESIDLHIQFKAF